MESSEKANQETEGIPDQTVLLVKGDATSMYQYSLLCQGVVKTRGRALSAIVTEKWGWNSAYLASRSLRIVGHVPVRCEERFHVDLLPELLLTFEPAF